MRFFYEFRVNIQFQSRFSSEDMTTNSLTSKYLTTNIIRLNEIKSLKLAKTLK